MRRRRKLNTKRQAERRARDLAELLSREDWADADELDWAPRTAAALSRPKHCGWEPTTRRTRRLWSSRA